MTLAGASCGGGSKSPAATTVAPEDRTPELSPTPSAATTPPATGTPVSTPDAAAAFQRRGQFEAAAAQYAAQAASAETPRLRVAALVSEASAWYNAGDIDTAIARLRVAVEQGTEPSLEATRALFLLALRLNEAGRAVDAVGLVTAARVAAAVGPLQFAVRAERADALLAAGFVDGVEDRFSSWGSLLKEPGLDPLLAERGYRAAAAAAAARRDPAGQAVMLERALAISGDAATRFVLAEALLAAGDRTAAVAGFGAIITGTPGSRFAHLAVIALRDLGEAVDPGSEGLVYYRRSLYADAIRVLQPVSDALAPGDQWAFVTYYLAASYDDSGLADEAVSVYDNVVASTPASPYAHRAAYWAARALERAGDAAEASERYAALAGDVAGEFREEAVFRAGYVWYDAGNPVAAMAAWDLTGATSPQSRFWRARALAALGEAQAARAAAESVARDDPFGFYGIEAAREIAGVTLSTGYVERKLGPAVDWSEIEVWAGVAPEAIDTAAAEEFAAAGLREPARTALYQVCPAGGTRARLLGCLRAATGLGLTDVALRFAVGLRLSKGATWADAPRSLMRLAYPVDFPELVDAESKEVGLDPLLLAALVRQESAWDPAAVSPADAYGLTQVIESTGEALAEALGVSPFSVSLLLRPVVSLRFGARYIADQVKRFGRVDAALAAYNGGPGRAERWLGAAGGAGTPEFVAAIDIEETAHYVAVVLEHYAHYRMAYGE